MTNGVRMIAGLTFCLGIALAVIGAIAAVTNAMAIVRLWTAGTGSIGMLSIPVIALAIAALGIIDIYVGIGIWRLRRNAQRLWVCWLGPNFCIPVVGGTMLIISTAYITKNSAITNVCFVLLMGLMLSFAVGGAYFFTRDDVEQLFHQQNNRG